MQWDTSLECGIEVIDHEHKELVAQLSRLMDESDGDTVREMLKFLNEYVVMHFAHEQLMQRDSGYPNAAEHKAMHVGFIDTLNRLQAQYEAEGNSPKMFRKTVKTVGAWLREHIMEHDRDFAEYCKAAVH